MFHWICPECGREIPPALTRCPACDPAAVVPAIAELKPVEPELPALDPLLALAETIRSVQAQAFESAGLPALVSAVGTRPAPEPVVTSNAAAVAEPRESSPGGVATSSAAAVAEAPPELAQPETAAEPRESSPAPAPTSNAAPITEPPPALAHPEPRELSRGPVATSSAAAIAEAPPELAQRETAAEARESSPAPAPACCAAAIEEAPPELAQPDPGALTPTPAAASSAAGIAEAPPELPLPENPAPITAELQAKPPEDPGPQSLALVESAPKPEPETVAPVPPVQPVLKDLAATPPDSSHAEQPPSGSWLQLAPLQNYSFAASRAMHPVAPSPRILTPDSGPRITLPGPALPADLVRLQKANPVTVIGEAPRRTVRPGVPGWLISLLLMIGIPLAGAGVLFYFQPIGHSSADVKPVSQEAPETPETAPPAATHSLAQLVEVTGFRIVVDYNKKSEIHYLVVNHSAADLSNMTIYVTLRTATAKPGQAPLCRFSFRAPDLGPFESKEMTSPIEKLARSVSMPDWQDLRAEVQVAQ